MLKIINSLKNRILRRKTSSLNLDENLPKSSYWLSNETAKNYDAATVVPNLDVILNKIFCDEVEKLIGRKSKILDIAAGTGVVTLEFSKRGHDVTATDISLEMLSRLAMKDSTVNIISGDIYEIQTSEKYPCIVSRWFVPHLRDWPTLLKHISDNFLMENGLLFFDMPEKLHSSKASKMGVRVPPAVTGYDDDPTASNYYFYASASTEEIKEAAEKANLKFVSRTPHGFFKSNLIFANSVGETTFKNVRSILLSNLNKNPDLNDVIYSFEKYLTPLLNPESVHGSIVILRK